MYFFSLLWRAKLCSVSFFFSSFFFFVFEFRGRQRIAFWKVGPNLFKIKLFKVWSCKGTQFALPLVLLDESEDSRTSAKSRNRRQVSNVTSVTISMHDVRHEITKQFEQLMPTKYCKSQERVCPVGPPGLPCPIGAQGPRGRRGTRGKVTQVALDHLENQEWLDFQI